VTLQQHRQRLFELALVHQGIGIRPEQIAKALAVVAVRLPEQMQRKAFLMELDELYCDTIVQRFENFSGRKAERISNRSNAPVSVTEALEAKN
jgi:hypothetical protein